MIWGSWSDFFAMGGYALYVWGSVVVVFGFMLGELVSLKLRRNAVLQQLRGAQGVRPQPQARRNVA
jgi:heme exporter protein D